MYRPNIMKTAAILFWAFSVFCMPGNSVAEEPATKPEPSEATKKEPPEQPRSLLHHVLFYIPDRLIDVVDIVRLRARVGPGIAVGARVTDVADAYLGTYASVYAGLPGPRMRKTPRSPVGFESLSGGEVSVAKATIDGGIGPHYSPTEIGASLHLLLIGIDIGVDPVELVDSLLGFLCIDIRHDDM